MKTKPLERSIDQGIVRWAKERWGDKMVIRKLSTLGPRGTNGDPDRLFVMDGRMLLIEMKRPGEECTPLQLQRHGEWRKAGATVAVVADVAAGRALLLQHFEGRRRQFSGVPHVPLR